MSLDNIVENRVFKPIDRGLNPYKGLLEYEMPAPADRKFRDYVYQGSKVGARIGSAITTIVGAVAPFVLGYYLADYATNLINSREPFTFSNSTTKALNAGGTLAGGVIFLPLSLRVFSRIGAAIGTFVGGTLGALYGIAKTGYKLFSRTT